MTMIVLAKALGFWFLLVPLAVANGVLREAALLPIFGPRAGLLVSGVLLCVVIFAVAWIAVPWLRLKPPSRYWAIGTIWLALTVLFEFAFGHYVAGDSWTELLRAYDVTTGNLWVVILAVTLVSPFVAAKVRSRS